MNKEEVKYLFDAIADAVWDEDWEGLEEVRGDLVYVTNLSLFYEISNAVEELIERRYSSYSFACVLDRVNNVIDLYFE